MLEDGKGKFFSVSDVAAELAMMVEEPPKRRQGPFLFAIDHCFQIKGHGTIMTGTALQVQSICERLLSNTCVVPHFV